jgi:hypothetical protein
MMARTGGIGQQMGSILEGKSGKGGGISQESPDFQELSRN